VLVVTGDARTFSTGFSGIDVSQFDPNHPSALTIDCGRSGSVYINSGALYGMEYVQWFKVILARSLSCYNTNTFTLSQNELS